MRANSPGQPGLTQSGVDDIQASMQTRLRAIALLIACLGFGSLRSSYATSENIKSASEVREELNALRSRAALNLSVSDFKGRFLRIPEDSQNSLKFRFSDRYTWKASRDGARQRIQDDISHLQKAYLSSSNILHQEFKKLYQDSLNTKPAEEQARLSKEISELYQVVTGYTIEYQREAVIRLVFDLTQESIYFNILPVRQTETFEAVDFRLVSSPLDYLPLFFLFDVENVALREQFPNEFEAGMKQARKFTESMLISHFSKGKSKLTYDLRFGNTNELIYRSKWKRGNPLNPDPAISRSEAENFKEQISTQGMRASELNVHNLIKELRAGRIGKSLSDLSMILRGMGEAFQKERPETVVYGGFDPGNPFRPNFNTFNVFGDNYPGVYREIFGKSFNSFQEEFVYLTFFSPGWNDDPKESQNLIRSNAWLENAVLGKINESQAFQNLSHSFPIELWKQIKDKVIYFNNPHSNSRAKAKVPFSKLDIEALLKIRSQEDWDRYVEQLGMAGLLLTPAEVCVHATDLTVASGAEAQDTQAAFLEGDVLPSPGGS